MNVLVTSENRFINVAGTLYSSTIQPSFFRRYLDVWDEVLVLARTSCARQPPAGLWPIDFQGVRLIGLPDFVGPVEYLKQFRYARRIVRGALAEAESIIFRMAGVIGSTAWPLVCDGRPFGVEVCGDPGTTRGSLRHPLRPFLHWYYLRDMRKVCRAAAATAYVTKTMYQNRYPPAPGTYTTNYSSIELNCSQLLQTPREFSQSQQAWRIVCVGTFSIMYKGQDVLLRAMARLLRAGYDLSLTFIGDGRYREEMEQLSRQLGICDRTKFLGSLPAGNAVLAELDKADLFVLPSRQDGLPRVLIEAMARGLPCIGSHVGGIPELIGPNELVPAGDPAALANKILELLKDPARMSRLSKRNLEVASHYTAEILQARRTDFYLHLRELTESWLKKHRPVEPSRAGVN